MEKSFVLTAIITLLPACTTLKDSLLLGGLSGAAIGAGFAKAAADPDRNHGQATLAGALSGGAFGAVLGYRGHREQVNK